MCKICCRLSPVTKETTNSTNPPVMPRVGWASLCRRTRQRPCKLTRSTCGFPPCSNTRSLIGWRASGDRTYNSYVDNTLPSQNVVDFRVLRLLRGEREVCGPRSRSARRFVSNSYEWRRWRPMARPVRLRFHEPRLYATFRGDFRVKITTLTIERCQIFVELGIASGSSERTPVPSFKSLITVYSSTSERRIVSS